MAIISPSGIWHNGETMLLFLDNDEGRKHFMLTAMVGLEQRNEMLNDVANFFNDSDTNPNEGATWFIGAPVTEQVMAFPANNLIAIGEWASNLPAANEFTNDEVARIKEALA